MLRSNWSEAQPTADDENAFLESHSWDEYAEWHLALTDGATDHTKAATGSSTATSAGSTAPGSSPAVYRAAEWNHKEIELAAHDLLQRLDASRT